jgi:hypothetical protein
VTTQICHRFLERVAQPPPIAEIRKDLGVPRLRTIAIVAVVAVVVTDVTWDDTSLWISIGRPGRKPIIRFAFP